jgi:hypothetical protein
VSPGLLLRGRTLLPHRLEKVLQIIICHGSILHGADAASLHPL